MSNHGIHIIIHFIIHVYWSSNVSKEAFSINMGGGFAVGPRQKNRLEKVAFKKTK
jgi:hypothetical protein